MRRLLFVVLILALAFVGFLFGSINQHSTILNLLVVSAELRVVDIALIFLLLGVVTGLLIAALYCLQRKTKGWLSKSSDNT